MVGPADGEAMSRTRENLQTGSGGPSSRGRRSTKGYHQAQLTIAGLAAVAAAGGAVAGCHPDRQCGRRYSAAFAGGVTALASRASRATLLVLAAVGCALSRSWLWIPAGAALGLAFASTFQRRSHTRMAALVGAIAVQVVLRWPSHAFHGFTVAAAVVVLAPVLSTTPYGETWVVLEYTAAPMAQSRVCGDQLPYLTA